MRYLILGSSIAFMMLIGRAITTNAAPSIDSYIKVDKDYNDFILSQFNELEDEIHKTKHIQVYDIFFKGT